MVGDQGCRWINGLIYSYGLTLHPFLNVNKAAQRNDCSLRSEVAGVRAVMQMIQTPAFLVHRDLDLLEPSKFGQRSSHKRA